MSTLINLAYLLAASLFIVGIKRLSSPATARRGNQLAALGMLVAVVATLVQGRILSPGMIVAGLLVGSAVGVLLATRVKMTSMPELVAAFNGLGGGASVLVAAAEVARYTALEVDTPAEYVLHGMQPLGAMLIVTVLLSVLIGSVTFSGSFVAFGKLGEWLPGRPISFPGMRLLTLALLLGIVAAGVRPFVDGGAVDAGVAAQTVAIVVVLALLLGVLLVIPIGGADMPVVVALLNSYSGLAAAATGFVLQNYALIVSGALVGASGLILTRIMCEAMNRSLLNVLIGGFGGGGGDAAAAVAGGADGASHRETSAEDAAVLMAYAQKVVIVPGYGLAVAQAQHQARELADVLEGRGVQVKYAIHPVAGRMPGHMNVLLAEANVPYEQLVEMDDINAEFETTDVVLVVGANDVVNPAARTNPASPIYGMPILDVDRARQTIVLKRSMRPGYAGVENDLFYLPNTTMLFGDAKKSLQALVAEVKQV